MQDIIPLKIFNFFFESPYKEAYLRELSKKLKLSPFAVKKYLDWFVKEGLILEERKANLRYFKANINNLFFRHLKIAFSIKLIMKSGLISYLKENISNTSSITLFGSTAKGEDDKESDIDILIIGKNKYTDTHKFREKTGKEINLHIFSWGEWNEKAKKDSPFYYEVISSGIKLHGELPIVKLKSKQ